MIGLLPILARWRMGLGIAGALAAFGLIAASWHYRHAYHAEQALRAADRAAYVVAQAQATLNAQRALEAKETEYRSKANAADQAFQSKLADARGAADRYVSSHRVRWEAVAGDASGTTSGSQGGGAQGADRSSAAPFMVAVSEGDIQVCTVNTQRLEAAREWALSLQNGSDLKP